GADALSRHVVIDPRINQQRHTSDQRHRRKRPSAAAMASRVRAAERVEQQRKHEQAEENPEQNDGDAGERRSDAAKSKHSRNQSGDKEADSPAKHGNTPFTRTDGGTSITERGSRWMQQMLDKKGIGGEGLGIGRMRATHPIPNPQNPIPNP